jgi:hypothetical protein
LSEFSLPFSSFLSSIFVFLFISFEFILFEVFLLLKVELFISGAPTRTGAM